MLGKELAVSNENFMDLRNGAQKTFEDFAADLTNRITAAAGGWNAGAGSRRAGDLEFLSTDGRQDRRRARFQRRRFAAAASAGSQCRSEPAAHRSAAGDGDPELRILAEAFRRASQRDRPADFSWRAVSSRATLDNMRHRSAPLSRGPRKSASGWRSAPSRLEFSSSSWDTASP